jgi:hypothetical protein
MRFTLLATTAVAVICLTLPSSATSPASTGIVCTQTAPANLAVPVAAGATIFSCYVTPLAWRGTIQRGKLRAPFTASHRNGHVFNIILLTPVTTAGTLWPGTVSTSP